MVAGDPEPDPPLSVSQVPRGDEASTDLRHEVVGVDVGVHIDGEKGVLVIGQHALHRQTDGRRAVLRQGETKPPAVDHYKAAVLLCILPCLLEVAGTRGTGGGGR